MKRKLRDWWRRSRYRRCPKLELSFTDGKLFLTELEYPYQVYCLKIDQRIRQQAGVITITGSARALTLHSTKKQKVVLLQVPNHPNTRLTVWSAQVTHTHDTDAAGNPRVKGIVLSYDLSYYNEYFDEMKTFVVRVHLGPEYQHLTEHSQWETVGTPPPSWRLTLMNHTE